MPTFPDERYISNAFVCTVQLLKTAGVPPTLKVDPDEMLMSPSTSSLWLGSKTPIPTLSVDTAKWIFEELPFTQLPLSEFTFVRPDPFPVNVPPNVRSVTTWTLPLTSRLAPGFAVVMPTRLLVVSTNRWDDPTNKLLVILTFPENV
jgi:hypothetical protein